MSDDQVIGKMSAKEIMSEGWIYLGIGAENYVVKVQGVVPSVELDHASLPSWDDRRAVRDWINDRIALSQMVAVEWPIKVYRQPTGMGMFPIVDSPRDFDKTIYESKVAFFNFGKVTNWTFVNLWKIDEYQKFFLQYFEDLGGRITTGDEGPLSAVGQA